MTLPFLSLEWILEKIDELERGAAGGKVGQDAVGGDEAVLDDSESIGLCLEVVVDSGKDSGKGSCSASASVSLRTLDWLG